MIIQEDISAKIASIPSIPHVVTQVLNLCENPNSHVGDIVETLKLDEAITLKVLNLCNSSYYGLNRHVDSLQDAVVFLGLNSLINLVLTTVASDFYRNAQNNYGLARGELWKHSVAVAITAQIIGCHVRHDNPDRLFTSGLLHDIGKTVLDEYLSDNVEPLREKIEQSGYTLLQAEEEVLGITHCVVGHMIAEQWELPPSLRSVIRHHHEPMTAEDHVTDCCICHLANGVVATMGIGGGASFGMANDLQAEALLHVNMPRQKLFGLSVEFIENYQKALALVNLEA